MPRLFVTTRVKNHTHAVYLRDDGSGQPPADNKPRHELISVPPQPLLQPIPTSEIDPQTGQPQVQMQPVLDPTTGQPLMQPEQIILADHAGHTPALPQSSNKPPAETDEEVFSRVLCLYKEAKNNEEKARTRAQESEDMVGG